MWLTCVSRPPASPGVDLHPERHMKDAADRHRADAHQTWAGIKHHREHPTGVYWKRAGMQRMSAVWVCPRIKAPHKMCLRQTFETGFHFRGWMPGIPDLRYITLQVKGNKSVHVSCCVVCMWKTYWCSSATLGRHSFSKIKSSSFTFFPGWAAAVHGSDYRMPRKQAEQRAQRRWCAQNLNIESIVWLGWVFPFISWV